MLTLFLLATLTLPPAERLASYGCTVNPIAKGWETTVWAEHADQETGARVRDWNLQLARHEGKKARAQCLNDCDRWMAEVEKQTKRRTP